MNRTEAFEVLGVEAEAPLDKVKQAYRSLAKKHHPDKNPGDPEAEGKFKRVQEAYDTLTKERPAQAWPGHVRRSGVRHLEGFLTISFMEAAMGCVRDIDIVRGDPCEACNGHGSKDGSAHRRCTTCGGLGRVTQGNIGMPFIQMLSTCGVCGGTGTVITDPCTSCHGEGQHQRTAKVSVSVPAGSYSGLRLCVKGEGDPSPGGVRGDLYLLVRVTPHHWFTREDDDLVCNLPVLFSEAILGCSIDVPGLDGTFAVKVPAGVRSGTVLRLRGQGFKDPMGGGRGDMLLVVNLVTPVADEDDPGLAEAAEQLAKAEAARPSAERRAFNELAQAHARPPEAS